jgi:hypothetical protein
MQWFLQNLNSSESQMIELHLALADYNPTVLQLVTLPNLLLSWAQITREQSWDAEGELEIDAKLVEHFLSSLKSSHINLSFFSGAWGADFVGLVLNNMEPSPNPLTIIGAETIYSPSALKSFADTLMSLLVEVPGHNSAFVAAKKVYFGVGGSMVDFYIAVRERGATIKQIREESDGVRRAVVEIKYER